jgi:hypothetical protein
MLIRDEMTVRINDPLSVSCVNMYAREINHMPSLTEFYSLSGIRSRGRSRIAFRESEERNRDKCTQLMSVAHHQDPRQFHGGPVSRHGFTLFEVAISLVIMTVGVISVLMLIPTGMKAQEMARMQILAATKAEEMLEAFTHNNITSAGVDTEGYNLWDVPVGYRSQSWDLETRLSNHRYGLMPVPQDIANRLDSDGNEIHRILSEGGRLYYSQPSATTNALTQGKPLSPPNESQRLVIAISGYAQQNILQSLPVKNWPYYTPMPSPPVHTYRIADGFITNAFTSTANARKYHTWPRPDDGFACFPWEARQGFDSDLQKVYEWREGNVLYGYFPYACGRVWDQNSWYNIPGAPQGQGNTYVSQNSSAAWNRPPTKMAGDVDGTFPSRESCVHYVQAAAWYFAQKLPSTVIDATGDPYATDYNPAAQYPYRDANEADRWKEVQAYRFLSHAATCLTAWYSLKKSSNDTTEDLTDGVKIAAVTLDGKSSPEFKVTHDLLRYYHERALFLAHDFVARYPYDWSVPRPAQRAIMMDHPLLQYDLFSVPYPEISALPLPIGGDPYGSLKHIFARPAATMDNPRQWRPVSSEPIRNIGVSMTYPGTKLDATMGTAAPGVLFGDRNHFNLTAPFAAQQRCREIIFWSVDWMSYTDCELAPSAPVDASMYPVAAPMYHNLSAGPTQPTYDQRLGRLQFRDTRLPTYRNPEKVLLFFPNGNNLPYFDIAAQPTGTDMEAHMIMKSVGKNPNGGWTDAYYPDWMRDSGTSAERRYTREVFSGKYGADRNFNRKLDRGPLPTSTRLYATQVARFNFYDPRVQAVVR